MKDEKRIHDNRQARLRKKRLLLMSIHKDADMNDIEHELALQTHSSDL